MFKRRQDGDTQTHAAGAFGRSPVRWRAISVCCILAWVVWGSSGCVRSPDVVREFHPDGTLKAEQPMEQTANGETAPHGRYRSYHPNGKLMEEGDYLHGEMHGLWTTYDDAGRKRGEQRFSHGTRHGVWKSWHPNGRLARQWQYEHGRKQGEWITYDETGRETSREVYDRDVLKGAGRR